jgi:3-hydroxybutyryl-CoA dehydrogenase
MIKRDMIKKVGVVGCGLMGSGIAQVSAQAGFETTVVEASQELLDRGLGGIKRTLEALVARAKLDERAAADALGRLKGATSFDALRDVDLVIEAITENQPLKNETFAKLDAICLPHALLASNTSSCNVTAMAAATKRPGQVLGLHFFNPVPLMKLVEVVRTLLTSEETLDRTREFARALGKEPIDCRDASGFIVNRLLVPYLLDAIRAHEEGVGSIEDIDRGMRLGCGHPMGPFELLDFVGLDTTLYIAGIMFDEYREKRFAPPPLLRRMVAAGRLGRKSGSGFYDHES